MGSVYKIKTTPSGEIQICRIVCSLQKYFERFTAAITINNNRNYKTKFDNLALITHYSIVGILL
jgi:hypothetical protein